MYLRPSLLFFSLIFAVFSISIFQGAYAQYVENIDSAKWHAIPIVGSEFSGSNIWSSSQSNGDSGEEDTKAQSELAPAVAPFSGPAELRILDGLCFTFKGETYTTRFCPFQNITQEIRGAASGLDEGSEEHKYQYAYSTYYGQEQTTFVLGYWSKWEANGTMVYVEGDTCNDETVRSARVKFVCPEAIGEKRSKVTSVAEPEYCSYELEFQTPFACGDFRPVSSSQMWLESARTYWKSIARSVWEHLPELVSMRVVDESFVEQCLALVEENRRLKQQVQEWNY